MSTGKPMRQSLFVATRDSFKRVPPFGALAAAARLSGIICFVLGALLAHAERYVEIRATVEITAYPLGDTNSASGHRSTFISRCIIGGSRWQIENDHQPEVEVKWIFDGTNVYRRARPVAPTSAEATENLTRLGLVPAPFAVAKSNATITIDNAVSGCPMDDQEVVVPWLAYCSGPYLQRPGRVVPLPVAFIRHAPDAFAHTDETEVFSDSLGLPRRMELFASEAQFRASLERPHFVGRCDLAAWKRAGWVPEDGALKFQYVVNDSTNYSGWNIPMEFEFFQLGRLRDGTWGIKFRGKGRTLYVGDAEGLEALFLPDTQQTFVDRRFRDNDAQVDGLIYPATTESVAPTSDPVLQKKFAAKIQRKKMLAPQNKPNPWTVRCVIILVLTAPLLIWSATRRRRSLKQDRM
jgi:hypothetical protein